jgi:hypothetical protein
MGRSRTVLVVAAGVTAGLTVLGVAAFAAVDGRPLHKADTSAAASDDVELQALAQLQGTSTTPSANPSGSGVPTWRNRGPGAGTHGLGRGPGGGFGGGLLGGNVLHGTLVVQGPDGKPVTVTVQRGSVTSISKGTLVVKSSDGFGQTWSTGTTTRFLTSGATLGRMHGFGSGPSPSPTPTASAPALAKGANVLVLGRSDGTTSTARLVVTVPDLKNFGGPGGRTWGGPGNGPMRRFHGPWSQPGGPGQPKQAKPTTRAGARSGGTT